jgi:hypothetical protein
MYVSNASFMDIEATLIIGRRPMARPLLGQGAGNKDSLATKARWLGAERQSAASGAGRLCCE